MRSEAYPPPEVWLEVDVAARSAAALAAQGRELDFRVGPSGRVEITLLEAGSELRESSVRETLAVAAGAAV